MGNSTKFANINFDFIHAMNFDDYSGCTSVPLHAFGFLLSPSAPLHGAKEKDLWRRCRICLGAAMGPEVALLSQYQRRTITDS